MGYDVRNPHEFCADIPRGSDDTVYYRRGVLQLCDCTDIVLLRGWKFSTGANLERNVAQTLGISIHESIEDFKQYILYKREMEAEANAE